MKVAFLLTGSVFSVSMVWGIQNRCAVPPATPAGVFMRILISSPIPYVSSGVSRNCRDMGRQSWKLEYVRSHSSGWFAYAAGNRPWYCATGTPCQAAGSAAGRAHGWSGDGAGPPPGHEVGAAASAKAIAVVASAATAVRCAAPARPLRDPPPPRKATGRPLQRHTRAAPRPPLLKGWQGGPRGQPTHRRPPSTAQWRGGGTGADCL